MTFLPRRLLAVLALLGGAATALAPGNARAETYRTCAGFIESLPATITTQGVWCLRENLATAIDSGNAITIATNNVTIDCNDFKIGGLAAGDGSVAIGIYAAGRQNATVRHCNVRGFYRGIELVGAGHLVEDNRLDNNLFTGIAVRGEHNRIRRNAVFDTGGAPGADYSFGIAAEADVIDNTVDGLFMVETETSALGIYITQGGIVVRGNQVRGLQVTGSRPAYGIYAGGGGIVVDGNHVVSSAETNGFGIYAPPPASACSNNVIVGFSRPTSGCTDAGGNTTLGL